MFKKVDISILVVRYAGDIIEHDRRTTELYV